MIRSETRALPVGASVETLLRLYDATRALMPHVRVTSRVGSQAHAEAWDALAAALNECAHAYDIPPCTPSSGQGVTRQAIRRAARGGDHA